MCSLCLLCILLLAACSRSWSKTGSNPVVFQAGISKKKPTTYNHKDLRQIREKKQPPKEHLRQPRSRERLQHYPRGLQVTPLGGLGTQWVAAPGVPHGDSASCPVPCPHSPALTGFSCSCRVMVWGAGCWVSHGRGEEKEEEEGSGGSVGCE